MPTVSINYLAIVVATVASMFIGYVYYAKPVMGKAWMALIGKTEEELKSGAGPAMVWMLILAFVEAYILAHFVDYTGATTWAKGAVAGIWLWLGFIVPSMGSENIFSRRPKKLLFLQLGYHLISIVVMGAILAVWK